MQALRAWYLARLRKRALAESSSRNLTPASLVQADRRAVEQLAAQDALPHEPEEVIELNKAGKLAMKANMVTGGVWCLVALICLALQVPCFVVVACMVLLAIVQWQLVRSFVNGRLQQKIADADTRLGDLELQIQLIADYALEVQFCLSPHGKVVAVSPSCGTLLGRSEVELLNRSMQEVIPPADYNAFSSLLQRARDAATDQHVSRAEGRAQTRFEGRYGRLLDISWTCEWSESRQHYFMLARDVTAQNQVKRAKGEFTAMVTHDLRSPIAGLIGVLRLIEHGAYGQLTGEGPLRVRAALASAGRILDIINDLLDIDRLEERKYPINPRQFDFKDALINAIGAMQPLAENKSVTLKINCPPVRLTADQACVERVLNNLLANAIKFSPENGTVTVTCTVFNDAIQVAVVDSGRGIPPELQEHLFERYKQVQVTDALCGSGLGLSICKLLIEAHGGTIQLYSEPGKGSSFSFILPTVPVAAPLTI